MKTLFTAALAAALMLCGAQAQAEPIVSAQCSTVGDFAQQIAGWRDHHKTKAQAYAQIEKYYADPSDRRVLKAVTDKLYADPAPKLVPDRVAVEITSDCVTGAFGAVGK